MSRHTSEPFPSITLGRLDLGQELLLGVPLQNDAIQIDVSGSFERGEIKLMAGPMARSIVVHRTDLRPIQAVVPEQNTALFDDPRDVCMHRVTAFSNPVSEVLLAPTSIHGEFETWIGIVDDAEIVRQSAVEKFANLIGLHALLKQYNSSKTQA